MAGNLKNTEKGIPGGYIDLDVTFKEYAGVNAPLADHDDYEALGTLPVVKIYDPSGTLVETGIPTRISQGKYQFRRNIGLNDTISDNWKILWEIKINGNELPFWELFRVVVPGDAEFDGGTSDCRIGEAFGNPDYESDHYYPKRGVPNFGLIVTPDELRYQYLWGNQLTSQRGDNFIQEQLQYFIDRAIGMVEKDLGITIIATQYRHRPPVNGQERDDLPKEADDTLKPFVWDSMYDFNQQKFQQFVNLKLNHKPVAELQKWYLFDISTGRVLLDLTSWAKLKHKSGYLRAYPVAATGAYPVTPPVSGVGGFVGGYVGYATGLYPISHKRYPNGYGVDYIAGYPNAKDVPFDLVEVIGMLAAINLMADFGDGVVSGLANASVSLSGISESFGTTLSATSAFFGARIKDYTDRLTAWLKENKKKYRGIRLAAL